jgi:hypothetical protein
LHHAPIARSIYKTLGANFPDSFFTGTGAGVKSALLQAADNVRKGKGIDLNFLAQN